MAKTAWLRNELLYEMWERFKELLWKCPHHGLPWLLWIQTFYDGLNGGIHLSINAIVGGSLMGKTKEATFVLLEKMIANNYQ